MANTGQAITGIVGGIAGGVIGFMVGGPVGAFKGAMYGGSLGLMLGGALFPPTADVPDAQRPAPSGLSITTSSYGLPIAVVFGTRKIGGNILYYGNFQTITHITETESSGGKGGGGGDTQTSISYTYTVSLAIGLCMGDMTVLNCWTGKNLVSPAAYIVYPGGQSSPDSHLQSCLAAEGKTRFPVWKNLCYVVFPNFDLGSNPNVPNFIFEVGPYSPGIDPHTQIMLHCNGTDGDYVYSEEQHLKPVWKDSSSNNYLFFSFLEWWSIPGEKIYRPYIDGSVKRFGDASCRFGMVNARLALGGGFDSIPLNLQPGFGDFTIDCWILWKELPMPGVGISEPYPIMVWTNGGYWTDYLLFGIYVETIGSYKLVLQYCNGSTYFRCISDNLADLIQVSTWYHVAAVRYGTSFKLYWGGNAVANGTHSGSIPETPWGMSSFLQVGGDAIGSLNGMTFNLDELRYSNIARWTTDFVPPSKEYTSSDVTPSWASRHILTNELYGMGLSESYLNLSNFYDTDFYCSNNDLLVSMVFDRQMSILDVLQYIIQHHNGFITYYNGQISHNQLKTENPSVSYTDDYIVKEGEEFPFNLIKKGDRSCCNKVIVEYTKKDNDYNIGTVMVEDSLDIANFGTKLKTIKLDGLTTFERAQKLAILILIYDVFNPQQISFNLGIKSLAIKPGDVILYTNNNLELNDFLIRIMAVRESTDYILEIDAREDGEIYNVINYGTDSSSKTDLPQLYAAAGTVSNEVFVEIHPIYANDKCILGISASKPNQMQWCGASLYQSSIAGGAFKKMDAASFSGVTGTVTEVGEENGDKYIDVQLTHDYTFSSATSLDELLVSSKQNLCICQGSYGDVYFRFQNCELIDVMKWRLSKLIFDCTGETILNSYGSIATPDKFCFSQIQFRRILGETDKHRTLYFKLPSFNFKGEEQSLADVLEKSKEITALVDIPLPPYNAVINGIGVNASNSITINAGQIDLSFCSRNRRALNFNTYNVDIPTDIDFSEFRIVITKDDDTILRTINQTGKTYSYTDAQQIEDGGPFETYKFKIYQKNASEISSAYTVIVNLV